MEKTMQTIHPVDWRSVNLTGGLLYSRQRVVDEVTIPIEFEQFEKTGRLASVDMDWKPGDPKEPHHHWDADIGKLIEAASYALAKKPNPAWEERIDALIGKIEAGQQPDGYFNTYYTVVEPGKRFTNLLYMHELYCAGHLIEGAVAYYDATGKRRLLDVMCRYVRLLSEVFGTGEGQNHGVPGHPEIELALIKLYRVTGDPSHLALCKYFVDQRGVSPSFFTEEREKREKKSRDFAPRHHIDFLKSRGPYAIYQAHKPVREQTEPVGHAVRAMYLYSGMTDLAVETGDTELLACCRTLWDSTTERYMHITGGIGTIRSGERFTYAYDLPTETTYNETCAAIGFVMWAYRLLSVTGDGKYADMMEQILYNGVLSGLSQSGDRFFYANYLAVYPPNFEHADINVGDNMQAVRQPWFATSCCPPNVARLLASIGGYIYGVKDAAAYIHLYSTSTADLLVGGAKVRLSQASNYPWQGGIDISVEPEHETDFDLRLRIPAWSEVEALKLNGEEAAFSVDELGYLSIQRRWRAGDRVSLRLSIPVRVMEANPAARQEAGCVALLRGPIVYCLEEVDNGVNLQDIAIDPATAIQETYDSDFFDGACLLSLEGTRRRQEGWKDLYRPYRESRVSQPLKAIPYYLWQNRGEGEMIVWIKALPE